MVQQELGLTARRAVKEDEKAIIALVDTYKPQYISQYGSFLVGNQIETSVLAITVVDENNTVCGFASFNDAPPGAFQYGSLRQHSWDSWYRTTFENTSVENMVWCTSFVCPEDLKLDVYDIIFHTCYATLHWVANILIFQPLESPEHNLLSVGEEYFSKLDPIDPDYFGPAVYMNGRDKFIPSMLIRRARLEDHDDLSPLCEQQSEALKSLYGDYFLAELIENQDHESVCLVAEVSGRAAGIMAATADVEVTLLNECFDLSLYDNLLKKKDNTIITNDTTKNTSSYSNVFDIPRLLASVYDPLVSIYTSADTENSDSSHNIGSLDVRLPSTQTHVQEIAISDILQTEDPRQLFASTWRQEPSVHIRKQFNASLYALLEQLLSKAILLQPLVPDVSLDVHGVPSIVNHSSSILTSTPDTIAALSVLDNLQSKDLTRQVFIQCIMQFASVISSIGEMRTQVLQGRSALDVLVQFLHQACQPKVTREATKEELENLEEERLDQMFAKQAFAAVIGSTSNESFPKDSNSTMIGNSNNTKIKSHSDVFSGLVDKETVPITEEYQSNAFAIVLYCLADALEPRSLDFLPYAFSLFPDRDYCILTLPHTYPEHDLLSHFTPIVPKPESTLPHALYVAHRDALQAHITVDWAVEQDSNEVLDLLAAGCEETLGNQHQNTQNPDLITQIDGIELVHGKLPAGSTASSVYQLYVASQEDDITQLEEFEATKQKRRLIRERIASLPKPQHGVDPQEEENKKAMEFEDQEESVLKFEDVRGYMRRVFTFCIRANGVLVGVIVLRTRDAQSSAEAQAAFSIHEYIQIQDVLGYEEKYASDRTWCSTTQPFADVVSVVVNPLFRTHLPRVCREILRLAYKQVLLVPSSNFIDLHGLPVYLKARTAPVLPKDTSTLVPLVNTHATSLQQSMGLLTRKLQSLPRAVIHARIVLVGASDTALCTVESLLSHPDVFLTNITIISPHSLPEGYPHTNATWLPWSLDVNQQQLNTSGLKHLVRYIQDAVVGVDTVNNILSLGSGGMLPYDCVAFTTGLSDATSAAVGADAWKVESQRNTHNLATALGIAYSHNDGTNGSTSNKTVEDQNDVEEGISSDTALFGEGLLVPQGAVEGLVTLITEDDAKQFMAYIKRKKPTCIVVYGDSLRSIATLGALQRNKVAGESIIWAFPGTLDAGEWCAGNAVVNATMHTALEAQQVTVLPLTEVEAVRCTPSNCLARIICRNVQTQSVFGLECEIMLCSNSFDANPYVFAALAAASAAYDGRLLITESLGICGISNPNVLAAGPLCKFSHKCHARAPASAWSPKVSGQCLATAIIQRVDSTLQGTEDVFNAVEELGAPGRGVFVECCGLHYLRATQEPIEGAVTLEQCRVLQSNQSGKYCMLAFGGRAEILTEITILADVGTNPAVAFPVKTIYSYIGMPSVYLPHLFTCQDDLLHALWNTATIAYAHDGINALRHAAAASIIEHTLHEQEGNLNALISDILDVPSSERILASQTAAQQLDEQKKSIVRQNVWEFIMQNKDLLPGYVVPQTTQ